MIEYIAVAMCIAAILAASFIAWNIIASNSDVRVSLTFVESKGLDAMEVTNRDPKKIYFMTDVGVIEIEMVNEKVKLGDMNPQVKMAIALLPKQAFSKVGEFYKNDMSRSFEIQDTFKIPTMEFNIADPIANTPAQPNI